MVDEPVLAEVEWLRRRSELAAVAFSPTGPVSKRDMFKGRASQMGSVLAAVSQTGSAVVIYGERGVGKTTLASLVDDFWNDLAREGSVYVIPIRYNCNPTDTFQSIWEGVVEEIGDTYEKRGEPQPQSESWLELFAEIRGGGATPHAVRRLLSLANKRFIMVFDEYDQVEDDECTALFASTMKALSDHLVPVTLILVGVATTIDELIADHASIDRSTRQVFLPRMSRNELKEIVRDGYDLVGLTVSEQILELMARLAQGLPHYAHRLGQEAGFSAVDRRSLNVEKVDVDFALKQAVDLTEESIRAAHMKATGSPQTKKNLFSEVLLACALTPGDDLGFFSAGEVRDPLEAVVGKHYEIPQFIKHLKRFANLRILEVIGEERRRRYRFENPLLKPYTVLKGLQDGLIDIDVVRRFEKPEPPAGGDQHRLL